MTVVVTPKPTRLPGKPCLILAIGGAGGSWPQKLIRIGDIIRGQPGLANHVAIVTHLDAVGRWIGIEGRPGGVGLVDCTAYLNSPYTTSNWDQPLPGGQAAQTRFLAITAKSLGIPYDWTGIAEDTLDAFGAEEVARLIDPLWAWPAKDGQMPGHVVCSSLAAAAYKLAAWAHPDLGSERNCTPGQWEAWNTGQQWKNAKPTAPGGRVA